MKPPKPNSPNKRPDSSFLRFSGMAFTMAAAIGLCVFIGYKADQWLQNRIPIGITLGAIVGVATGMYMVIKDLTRK